MNRYLLALASGSLLGVLIGTAIVIVQIERCDGRQELGW